MPHKLNYKIIGRRRLENDQFDMEYVDVEWTHTGGDFIDTIDLPTNHPSIHPSMPSEIVYHTQRASPRKVVKDQVTVRPGTPDSVIMQMLEEKRAALAANLGVEP
jgi:hypothetical protein